MVSTVIVSYAIGALSTLAAVLLLGEWLSERNRRREADIRLQRAEYPQPHLKRVK